MSGHWFAASWWTDVWGWRTLGICSFALSAESIWGAVRFGGGWTYPYGVAAVVAFAIGVAFFATAHGHLLLGNPERFRGTGE